ncbi:hypothetical protein Egran_06680 [Elaphomyces granulatus]|uniref:DUF8212 domain-containing protein n=1 Tax=Elaphomyces granulatus TaxID=519963 RepID=A0A232LN59_9EURO|nr:hypothetical protein Egran_06680 [Elaphomyces granulatus]
MPLLYGEGVKAFIRLQEEILKEIDDHSLFAWTAQEDIVGSVFAQSPAGFAMSGNIIPVQEESGELSGMTRKGLRITLGLQPAKTSHLRQKGCVLEAFYIAILNCARDHDTTQRIALLLIVEALNQPSPSFYRCATKGHLVVRNDEIRAFHTIYVRKNVPPETC